MTELPPGWAWATMGQVADTQLGKMLSAKARSGNAGRPYLRNKNVQWGRIDVDDLLTMDFSDEEFEKFQLREGDLLVCEGGEVGRAAIWRGGIECGYQKALHRVRPRPGVMPEYLLYLLEHYASTNAFERYVTGSTIAHLPQEDLRELPLPVPPLAEQRRIVAAIEEQLSRLEVAEQQLQRVQSQLDGLSRALKRRASRSRPGWETVPFGQAFRVVSDEGRKVKQRDYLARGRFPVVDQGEVFVGGYTEDEQAVYRGPLPIILFGDHTRRFKLLKDRFAVGADGVKILAPSDEWDPEFALAELESTPLPNRGYSRHFQFLRKATFSRPSMEQQRKIVASLRGELDAVARFRKQMVASAAHASSLRLSILASAFRGELAPQDPSDEPARLLLERIAAERDAAPKPKRKRKRRENMSA